MFEKQPWMQRAGEYPQSDHDYFRLLARAIFSAGLGAQVVEARWPDMVKAFQDFAPERIGAMDEGDIRDLLGNPGIIRNRRKIQAVIHNARVFLQQVEKHRSFHQYLVELGAGSNLDRVAEKLAEVFTYLGKTSALFFLFSAGWRSREVPEGV